MTTTTSQPEATTICADDVFLGDSPAVQRLRLQVTRIAPHFRTALLSGEPGLGKQTVARRMHRLSPGASRPFTVIPCADFVQQTHFPADGRTLYLPGLDALRPASQGQLLRALKFLHRETRVIVASQSDIKGMVSAGKLRHDVYQAVGTLEIRIAPLRERLDDLEAIATAMLIRLHKPAAFDAGALAQLRACTWPGNLQELWSLCGKLAPQSSIVNPRDLPPLEPSPASGNSVARLEEVMHRHVRDVLEGCSGNKLRAAELLGISRSTLYRMLGTQDSSIA
jgi:DNA-binding NtrC family response regulator